MEPIPTGVSLDVEEVLICGINTTEVPHPVSFSEIPGVIQGLARTVAAMRNAHNFLVMGYEDGSEAVTSKVLEKSKAKIAETSALHDGLIKVFNEHILGS